MNNRWSTNDHCFLKAAKLLEPYEEAAKERQKEHGKTAPGKAKTLVATLPEVNKERARDEVAKEVGISGRSVQ